MAAMMQRHHGTIVPSKSKELITIVAAKITGNYLSFTRKKNHPLLSKVGQIPKRAASFIIEALSLLELWGRKNFDMHGRGGFWTLVRGGKLTEPITHMYRAHMHSCVCAKGDRGSWNRTLSPSFPAPFFQTLRRQDEKGTAEENLTTVLSTIGMRSFPM